MPTRFAAHILIILLLGWLAASPLNSSAAESGGVTSGKPSVVVVGGAAFQQSFQAWQNHRSQQGYDVRWVSNEGEADDIRERLRAEYRAAPFQAVALLGDVVVPGQRTSLQTPTHYRKAVVNIKFGSEPEIATDFPYADLNDDGLPDVAVGRFPADTPQQLAEQAQRVIDYETTKNFGRWRTRINFVAGVGGFGSLTDMVLEMTTKSILTDGIPPAYTTKMTYGSWRSPYCPNPKDFHRVTVERLNEGCLFWVYIGHGQVRYLDSIKVPGRRYGILTTHDAPKLQASGQPPIAIFLSCYAGAFDKPDDCLAEEMFKQPGGPVAVYSGSRVTMPYAMAIMSHAMGKLYFDAKETQLGELIRLAKHELANPPEDERNDPRRQMLDRLAAAISPAKKLLDAERREHLLLFNLIGDPLLRLPLPATAVVAAPEEARAGETIEVKLNGAVGDAILELACRRDQLRRTVPQRQRFNSDPLQLEEYNATYEFANNSVWLEKKLELAREGRVVPLTIPSEARGHSYLNLHVQNQDGFAIGSAPIYIRPANSAE